MVESIEDLSLPRLAWIAEYNFINNKIIINYGEDVEIGADFLVEGVWDGQYENLNFDTSNNFFGSGLKINNNQLIAVPSTGLVDRIFIGESQTRYFISNSLIEILARTNSQLIKDHNYKIQTNTIHNGIKKYENDYPISSDMIDNLQQYFYHSIALTKHGIRIIKRPKSPVFLSYEHYICKLKSSLNEISTNASSQLRNKNIDLYTTVSKGYDSTAVTALTSDLPIKSAFTSKTSNSSFLGFLSKHLINDDGTEIAEKLGLNVTYLDYNGLEIDQDELYFLAATTGGPEVQFYKMHKIISSNENPGIIFTGYHGDTVWSLSPPKKALTDDILKPGASGLTLSEVRLKSGFIDIPVPTIYARSIVSINHLSRSEEMSKWSIGGDYDRPIPRRIVESRGIRRNSFGRKKRAIATFYDLPMNKMLRNDFLKYMKTTNNKNAIAIVLNRLKDQLEYYLRMFLFVIDQTIFKSGRYERPLDVHTIDTPYHMHLWSLSKLVGIRKKELVSGLDKMGSV